MTARVAFGLQAIAVALKARTGRLRERDRTDIAISCLKLVPADEDARAAVLRFLQVTPSDPVGAGLALQDFIRRWCARVVPDQQHPAIGQVDAARLGHHPWQQRADFQ